MNVSSSQDSGDNYSLDDLDQANRVSNRNVVNFSNQNISKSSPESVDRF